MRISSPMATSRRCWRPAPSHYWPWRSTSWWTGSFTGRVACAMSVEKEPPTRTKGDVFLEIRDLRVEGQSDDVWGPIVKGVSLTVRRGEVLGLIGESGAGKSTIGLAAMGFVRQGCRFAGGSVVFDGIDLLKLKENQRRKLRSRRIAYVAQSAAASFN